VDGVSALVAEFVAPKGMLQSGCGMYVEAFEESYPSLDGFSWCCFTQQCMHSFPPLCIIRPLNQFLHADLTGKSLFSAAAPLFRYRVQAVGQ
jgi:hypothetical protein